MRADTLNLEVEWEGAEADLIVVAAARMGIYSLAEAVQQLALDGARALLEAA